MTKTTVLFFSRGRGHGHAIPDDALTRELELLPDISVRLASYGTGLRTLSGLGHDAYPLNIEETAPFLDVVISTRQAIDALQPDVVIAHEEFAAVFSAYTAGIPAIFISAWLPLQNSVNREALRFASSIVVLGEPGLFSAPAGAPKPQYAGSLHRKMAVGRDQRGLVRAELGLDESEFIFVVVTGGAAAERDSPLASLIFGAYEACGFAEKRLYWLSNKDAAYIKANYSHLPNVTALPFYSPIEKLLLAADVILTKGTRGITLDAAALGVPSISISHGNNPIDDLLVPRIKNNVALSASALDPEALLYHIRKVRSARETAVEVSPNVDAIASRIASEVRKLNIKSDTGAAGR